VLGTLVDDRRMTPMPTYDYRCANGHEWEASRPMDDRDGPSACPECCEIGKRVFKTPPVLAWSQASAEGGRPNLKERVRQP
jgi:putative FmdB family regulatory protein